MRAYTFTHHSGPGPSRPNVDLDRGGSARQDEGTSILRRQPAHADGDTALRGLGLPRSADAPAGRRRVYAGIEDFRSASSWTFILPPAVGSHGSWRVPLPLSPCASPSSRANCREAIENSANAVV